MQTAMKTTMKATTLALLTLAPLASLPAAAAEIPPTTAPQGTEPAAPPPALRAPIPPPPRAQTTAPAVAVATPPAGQWTYTTQYGWVWMPYDAGYTSVVPDASLASMYVYGPAFGWRWVDAPWVLGLGVTPYWGAFGPHAFAWYAHPWFHRNIAGFGHGPAMRGPAMRAPAFHAGLHAGGHRR
jgi:hypothetical protein